MERIVPGHVPNGDARSATEQLIACMERLRGEVATGIESGRTVSEAIAEAADPRAAGPHPTLAQALEEYTSTTPPDADDMPTLARNLHRLNILATYRALDSSAGSK
jgi:cyclase